jgi:pentatricopeptide repeat protein
MAVTPSRYCRKHPRIKAGWSCPTCNADLCPDCVATKSVGHRTAPVDLCCECRRRAEPITVHRSEIIPFWQRVLDAPRFPLNMVGLLSLAVLGFVNALTSYVAFASMMIMGGGVFLLRQGLFWASVFFIIRDSGAGATRMGVLGLRDIQSDVVAPAIKGIVSTALVWLPAVVYIVAVAEGGLLGILTYEGHKDPVVWLLALIGIVYAPMALLAGATDLGFGEILNPIRIFTCIKRMGRDYFLGILAVAIVLVAGRILEQLVGMALDHVNVIFLPRWGKAIVSLYPSFIAARILGVLLFTRGEALDWGRSEDYQVPVLLGVRPRGKLPDKPERQEEPLQGMDKPAKKPAKPEPRAISLFDPLVDPQVAPQVGPEVGLPVGPESRKVAAPAGTPAIDLGEPSGPSLLDLPDDQPLDLPGSLPGALPESLLGLPQLGPPPSQLGPPPSQLGLPPSQLGPPPSQLGPPPSQMLEAHAYVEPEKLVDLPAAFASPPPVSLRALPTVAPKPSGQATVRGFSPLSQPASPSSRPVPSHDPAATVIGHASPLTVDAADLPEKQVPVEDKSGAVARLVQTVEAGRMEEALRLYRDMRDRDSAIPDKIHMSLGKAAAKARDFDTAARAFGQVAFTRSELAGQALVSLAQVIGDGQKNLVWAKKLYLEAKERFPGTDVAAYAERRLSSLG